MKKHEFILALEIIARSGPELIISLSGKYIPRCYDKKPDIKYKIYVNGKYYYLSDLRYDTNFFSMLEEEKITLIYYGNNSQSIIPIHTIKKIDLDSKGS